MTAASYNLARSLVERGHDITVYTTDVNDAHTRIPDTDGVKDMDGVRVCYFRNISNLLAFKRIYLPSGLITAAKNELSNFDIIHVNEYRSFQSIIIHHYAKKYGIPYILQAHGSVGTYFQKGNFKRFFDRIWGHGILEDASRLIAVTPVEAEQYRSLGVTEDSIEIVPNGINLSEFENLPPEGDFRRKYGFDQDLKIILYLARINMIKGPDLLVRSFAKISGGMVGVKLVITGPDDGYLPSLIKLVKELGIEEKVLFTGPLYGRDKLEAYTDADVYVLPSRYEIFGISILESFACGTPVIVTDRCGLASMINNQAGIVASFDKDKLSDAIFYLLSNDKKRQEFGGNGRLMVREKFNWPKVTEQLEGIYLDCLK
ncbi:glycosyltransferase [Chloroflexota bacterium]